MPYTIQKSSKSMLRLRPHSGFYDATGWFELVHIWQIGKLMIMKWKKLNPTPEQNA